MPHLFIYLIMADIQTTLISVTYWKHCVNVNMWVCDVVLVTCGVPQGSVLEPFIFSYILNEIQFAGILILQGFSLN